MRVYKIFRAAEWQAFEAAGTTDGAPIDLQDGYVHLSTGAQVAETLRLHFAGTEGLILLALDANGLGDALRWEASRGGDLFPHLYRALAAEDVLSAAPLRLDGGAHVLPDRVT